MLHPFLVATNRIKMFLLEHGCRLAPYPSVKDCGEGNLPCGRRGQGIKIL
jgi:hypothetical protein